MLYEYGVLRTHTHQELTRSDDVMTLYLSTLLEAYIEYYSVHDVRSAFGGIRNT